MDTQRLLDRIAKLRIGLKENEEEIKRLDRERADAVRRVIETTGAIAELEKMVVEMELKDGTSPA